MNFYKTKSHKYFKTTHNVKFEEKGVGVLEKKIGAFLFNGEI